MERDELKHGSGDPSDPITAQLRRIELERPDALLRQRVMADVQNVLSRPTARARWRPAWALGALAAATFLSFWASWDESVPRPEIPSAYVEDTARWLDLSPELARHVVRPALSPVVSKQPTPEGRLRYAINPTIDL